ncbi:MAG: hypothetical protein NTZ08_07230, partial [Verrucomicrobia bacterium]|nr:hypothetical protein [Verrucomicrobiota bacterium]
NLRLVPRLYPVATTPPHPHHAVRQRRFVAEKWGMPEDAPPMSTTPRHRLREGQPPACPKNETRGNHSAPFPPRRAPTLLRG